jgi:hypothetical protein
MQSKLVTDSPARIDPLFIIEVPDIKRPGEYLMHHATTDICTHQSYLDILARNGSTDHIERRVR